MEVAETLLMRVSRLEKTMAETAQTLALVAKNQLRTDNALKHLAEVQAQAQAEAREHQRELREYQREARERERRLDERIDKLVSEGRERERRLDERVDKLVSAVGELIRRSNGRK
jgi:hypothetical protein